MDQAGRHGARWTARRYYIQGDLIKPVIGSELTDYHAFAGRDGRLLHLELAALDAQNARAVEEFTSTWGLLGLFYDPVLQIAFGSKERGLAADAPGLAFYDAIPAELHEMRGEGTVLLRAGHRYEQRQLRAYAEPYFPGVADLPAVLFSPARWDHLCEPLSEFQTAVGEFRDTFEVCVEWTARGVADYPEDLLQARFHRHTAHVVQIPRREAIPGTALPRGRGGLWAGEWLCPSLLAAAYAMLKDDLLENRNLRFCSNERCRRPFIGDRSDQQFCSIRCLKAQKQREARQEARERQSTT